MKTLDNKSPLAETSPKSVLWIITELYYPEETSTGYYLTRIAEGLINKFNVRVICGQPNYSARGIRAPKHQYHKSVEIFRSAGTGLNKNVILFRLVNMATLSFGILFTSILRFRNGDRVLVVTTPPSLPFVAAIATLFRGAGYTLLIHDNYPEMLVAVGKARDGSFIVRVLNFFNRWLYKHAAKIVVVGRDMQLMIEEKTRGLDIPIEVIPNWAELETVHPTPKFENQLLQEYGLLDKFILLYAGNLGHPNDIETIISCADRLRDHPTLHFILLGTGAKETWLRRELARLNLTNVTLLGSKPRSEQIVFLNACDVGLVSLVEKMRGVSMPSRTYNIMAAGKPILALTDENSELAQVIDEERIGWHVPPGEPDQLLDAILNIYETRNSLAEMGERSRAAAVTKYSMEFAVAAYHEALE